MAESITRGGEIYFIGERDLIDGKKTSYVKIGLTRDDRASEERQSDHQTGNPRELFLHHAEKVVMVQTVEKALHWHFAERRVAGEWFVLDDARLADAIEKCRKLGIEYLSHVPIVEAAERLATIPSQGDLMSPTESSLHWWREHQVAHHIVTACGEVVARYRALLEAEIDKGNDVGGAAARRTTQVKEFNENGFKERYPDLWEKYLGEPSISSRFTVTKMTDDELAAQPETSAVGDVLGSFAQSIEDFTQGRCQLTDLRAKYLHVLSRTEYQKTLKELASHYLMSFCGTSPGIAEVCKWRRSEAPGKLDRASLQETEPDKYREFVTLKERQSIVTQRRAGASAADS
jgi:hypothetical protein